MPGTVLKAFYSLSDSHNSTRQLLFSFKVTAEENQAVSRVVENLLKIIKHVRRVSLFLKKFSPPHGFLCHTFIYVPVLWIFHFIPPGKAGWGHSSCKRRKSSAYQDSRHLCQGLDHFNHTSPNFKIFQFFGIQFGR